MRKTFPSSESQPALSPNFRRRHIGLLRSRYVMLIMACVLNGWPTEVMEAAETGAKTAQRAETRPEVTQHEITPMLLLRCTVCHGLRRQEGGLDLRTKASMLKGGKSGPAMVLGKPEESLMHKRIVAEQCPPRLRVVEVSVKPMESNELALLKKWIETGAPEIADEPDAPGKETDQLISGKDRQFWAFQAPKAVQIPLVGQGVRNPIDAFILDKLRDKGLGFTPPADRSTLMRRAYFDLTGLPPEPEEVEAFLSDSDPMAYEKMLERLLSSPRYGERWGRHWLDLAGYADSEGKREQDEVRPDAYRYRDYVIRSFNSDKPYDRFLLEQIAGDELADYESAKEITDELCDNLVATGFLRMAPDSTVANITAFVPDRLDVIGDAIDVLGSGVMGLTIGCAKCHSHKFDPIPHRDYYRLSAALKGAYDEHDWLTPNGRRLPYVTTKERRQWEANEKRISAETELLKAPLNEKASQLRKKYFEERLAQLPAVLRDDVRKALEAAADKRTEVQKYLGEKFEKSLRTDDNELKKIDPDFKKAADENDKKLATLGQQRRPEPTIRALWDRGEPSPTYILNRGNYLTPGHLVGPGALSILTPGNEPFDAKPPWPGAKKTGRRLALAKWLTHPEHPLTSRVMANRIWKHHFESGIVKSTGNFGRMGTPPTHPELLDWLARDFVRGGWSIKALHRSIMTSATYRQSSALNSNSERLDPGNDLLSRFPLKRMEAEVLADTVLQVSGRLDETPFGPPDKVQVRGDGLVTSVGNSKGWRRSIHVQQRRKEIPTILEAFDLPQMNPNCLARPNSVVATQALHLMNNGMIHGLAASLSERLVREAGHSSSSQIKRLYLIALSRLPTTEEEQIAIETLTQLTSKWAATKDSNAKRPASAIAALANVCHAMINSAEFIFID
ncbi:MAG: DUF1553 domain-containing protein [Pedosphaera sp.]|nr:DUF1553 domain-containing protein [Pedosphaera sp.]